MAGYSKLAVKFTAKKGLPALFLRYKNILTPACFLGGFGYDVATLERIDHRGTLIQQAVCLSVIGWFLVRDQSPPKWLERFWTWRGLVVHFLFGVLLSMYTIFYFKSASLLNSFLFMATLIFFFILNESHRVQHAGLTIKLALFSLCICSYFAYLVPILWRSVGLLPFSISILLSTGLCFYLSRRIPARWGLPASLALPALFALLYYVRVLPPVPLALVNVGIYHDIQKDRDRFKLLYTRSDWRFWERGDQTFLARDGDSIHCFASVFAPTNFRDAVFARWQLKNRRGKWETTDRIPIVLLGGRARGFRAVTYKKNYTPGRWRVLFETTEEREIGRIYFWVEPDPDVENEREFKIARG